MPDVTVTIGEKPIGVGYGKIHAEGIDVDEAAQELVCEVERFLTLVSEDAPSACIDGRKCVACMDGSDTEPRPGVAGGGLVSAYAAAELIGWFADDAGDESARMQTVLEYLNSKGVATGTHCDEAAVASDFAGKTGCGANDNLPAILTRLHADKAIVDTFTGIILNTDPERLKTTYVDARTLQARHKNWIPAETINIIGEIEGQRNIEILSSDDSETHGHNELAVVFNDVENTTVDRDALFAATGKQVFDVDVWYLRKLAKAMASGPDAVAQEERLLNAMVAYQVATYLTLCDGSQRPIFCRNAYALAA
jgi:hypothetical protein